MCAISARSRDSARALLAHRYGNVGDLVHGHGNDGCNLGAAEPDVTENDDDQRGQVEEQDQPTVERLVDTSAAAHDDADGRADQHGEYEGEATRKSVMPMAKNISSPLHGLAHHGGEDNRRRRQVAMLDGQRHHLPEQKEATASEPRPQATLVCQGWSELARWIGLARCIVEQLGVELRALAHQLGVACINEGGHQFLCGLQLGRPQGFGMPER